MHREFNSAEMIASRHKAAELLEAHPQQTIPQLRSALGRVEMQNVWDVVYFYQRLWLAIQYGSLRNKYVPKLFGDIFYWWYDRSFESQYVPCHTTISEDLDDLRKWLDDHTTELQRKKWREANRAFATGSKSSGGADGGS